MSISITIQAVASLQSNANLTVTAPSALGVNSGRTAEKPVTIVTEFQQGTRNARIERLASGEHGVLCYDAATDYSELLVRQSIQSAMVSAESWVKRQF